MVPSPCPAQKTEPDPVDGINSNHLVNNEVSQPLFDMAKGETPLRLTPALVTAEIPVPIFRSNPELRAKG